MKRTPLKRRTPLRRTAIQGTLKFLGEPLRHRHATPAWADADAIREVYREARELAQLTGQPHQVDHIVPLNHRRVCGLHVAYNLAAVPSWFNLSKGNRFDPDGWEPPR